MATTTNFGWETPDDTDLVKDGAAAIRTALGGVDTSFVDLKGGTTGQVLAKASNTDLDFVWSADAAGMTNPMTTAGDLIRGGTSGAPTRLGIGTTGQVLTVSSGLPAWVTPSATTPTAVMATAFNTSNFTLATGTDTLLTMNSESIDTDAFHSTSTNTSRLTIPSGKNGKYQVIGKFSFANNATGRRYIALYKNGTPVTQFEVTPATSTYPTIQFTWFDTAVATDYYECYAFQSSGGNLALYGGSDNMQFGINFIGA